MDRIEAYTDEKVRYVDEKRADDKAKINTIVVENERNPHRVQGLSEERRLVRLRRHHRRGEPGRNYQETYSEITGRKVWTAF